SREPAPQIKPPLPVAAPPADAETITGVEGGPRAVIHIKRLASGNGPRPQRNDTVKLNFTGWRMSGETFVTTTVRKRPVEQSLARLAPGFAAAVVSMQKGERAMVWIPPELGYMGTPQSTPETTVYEVELVDIEAGPPTPPNVAAPPPDAPRTASGAPYERVKRGTGKDRPRFHDLVQIDYSAWMATGRLVDSTEVTRQPEQTFVFRKPPAIEEVLRTMVVGDVVRVWVPERQLEVMPPLASGTLCYEIELLSVRAMTPPPPVPKDVAAPPAGAKKTAKGVFYKELAPGTGTAKPGPTEGVKVHYTGWTTDGRLFDSSIVRGEAAAMKLDRALPGLADGLETMTVGSRARMWVPVELAYQDAPGAPKGMLVFDVELLEILP
ncbi:MAG: FKBP-type peptidyl-prolyl cis-trans isomerase, partial [Deltaproteobacteria bacterium]|nr:FKBP-type peptidyl-prolyl cis-trans isomerase [Kofleriaceae bacterium]